MAENVLKRDVCDRITFIPAWVPPHKVNLVVTAFEHRMAMLKLAVEPYPEMNVSDIEFREQRVPSYTLDTLRSLRNELPDDELMILIGGDSLRQMYTWYGAHDLVAEFKVVTYPRPDEAVTSSELRQRWNTAETEKLLSGVLADVDEYDISSTLVREVKTEKSSGLIPEKVAKYITINALY